MSNVVKLPGPNSRARARFQRKRARQKYEEVMSRLEADMAALEDFSDIKSQADIKALAENDPYRFFIYSAQVCGL